MYFSIQSNLSLLPPGPHKNFILGRLNVLQSYYGDSVLRDDSRLAWAFACNNLNPIEWPLERVVSELKFTRFLYEKTQYPFFKRKVLPAIQQHWHGKLARCNTALSAEIKDVIIKMVNAAAVNICKALCLSLHCNDGRSAEFQRQLESFTLASDTATRCLSNLCSCLETKLFAESVSSDPIPTTQSTTPTELPPATTEALPATCPPSPDATDTQGTVEPLPDDDMKCEELISASI